VEGVADRGSCGVGVERDLDAAAAVAGLDRREDPTGLSHLTPSHNSRDRLAGDSFSAWGHLGELFPVETVRTLTAAGIGALFVLMAGLARDWVGGLRERSRKREERREQREEKSRAAAREALEETWRHMNEASAAGSTGRAYRPTLNDIHGLASRHVEITNDEVRSALLRIGRAVLLAKGLKLEVEDEVAFQVHACGALVKVLSCYLLEKRPSADVLREIERIDARIEEPE